MSAQLNIGKARAVVTGGGGFLGRALCSALVKQGIAVTSIARGDYPELRALGVETLRVDLAKPAVDLAQIFSGAAVVFHVAAKVEMWGAYQDFYRGNVLATRNVIEACKKAGVRDLVFTSSPSVISGQGDLVRVNEQISYPARYLAFYPQTKAEAEREVLAQNGVEGLRTLALRPHLIFGPGDTSLIPAVLEKAKGGKLRQIGDGKNLVDLTFIDDCVTAHIQGWRALSTNPRSTGRAYFISQGDPVPLWWWIAEVLERSGQPALSGKVSTRLAYTLAAISEFVAKLIPGKKPALTRFLVHEMSSTHYFDISAARTELGYKPSVSVAQALDLTFSDSARLGSCG